MKSSPMAKPMRRPLLGVLGVFFIGLVLREYLEGADIGGWLAAGGGALAAGMCWWLRLALEWRYLGWLLVFGALGWVRGGLPPQRPLPPEKEAMLVGRAASGWSCTGVMCRLTLDLEGYSTDLEHWQAGGHRVLLSVHTGENAGGCAPVWPGERIRVKARLKETGSFRNPGLPDQERSWRRRGVLWRASAGNCRRIMVEATGEGPTLPALMEKARQRLTEFFRQSDLPGQAGALLASLTVGRREGLSPDLQESIRRSGLSHLLAISGLHLMLVAAGLFWLMLRLLACVPAVRRCGDARALAAAAAFVLSLGYTLLSGGGLPVVRALVMSGCGLAAVVLGRERDWAQVLCAAALLVLMLWPQSLWTAGFQLSFSAVLGVILAAPAFYRLLGVAGETGGGPKIIWFWTARLFSVSLAAWLFTLPVLILHFGQISLWGPLVNLAAVPLAAWLVVPLGLAAVALYPLSSAAAEAAARLAAWPALGLEKVAGWGAELPGSFVLAPLGRGWLVLAFSAGLVLVFLSGRRVRAAGLSLMLVSALVQAVFWVAPRFSQKLEATFLDVGQGDAALVRTPGGGTLLIDGGPTYPGGFDAGRMVGRFLQARGILRLDAVLATHGDLDHVGGLTHVVRHFRPRVFYAEEGLLHQPAGRTLLDAARGAGARVVMLSAGDETMLSPGVKMTVLWPPADAGELGGNERSLAVRIEFGRHRFLFLGDLDGEGERRILETAADLSAAVVKVAHHGSRGASRLEFVARVGARAAVLSVGQNNPFGLPHPQVLENWRAAGAELWRTDLQGAITATSDGDRLRLSAILPR